MAFHDTRLPEEVERGVTGGPGFNTSVTVLSSGYEQRNQNWENARLGWNVGYGILNKDPVQAETNFSEVLAFFYARRGQANSFRFKDWADYTIGDDESDTPQSIGTGDNLETDFQIVKTYEPGAYQFDRIVNKPVSGTVRVFLAGVEQFAGYTIDHSTGIVSFAVAPGSSVDVAVICEFDVAVRFDVDKFEMTLETFMAGAIPNLPIVEVRGE